MRPAFITALALATVLLCGCTGPDTSRATGNDLWARPAPPTSKIAKVQPGMEQAEVEGILGPPARTTEEAGPPTRTVWWYDEGIVILRDGKVEYSFPEGRPKS